MDILYEHIKQNRFVQRWMGRMIRSSLQNEKDKRAHALGLFVRNRTIMQNKFGDVEFACYESWAMAYKNNDRQGMMNAITHAMNDEFLRTKSL